MVRVCVCTGADTHTQQQSAAKAGRGLREAKDPAAEEAEEGEDRIDIMVVVLVEDGIRYVQ